MEGRATRVLPHGGHRQQIVEEEHPVPSKSSARAPSSHAGLDAGGCFCPDCFATCLDEVREGDIHVVVVLSGDSDFVSVGIAFRLRETDDAIAIRDRSHALEPWDKIVPRDRDPDVIIDICAVFFRAVDPKVRGCTGDFDGHIGGVGVFVVFQGDP